jgi:tetratricopeptide (TPR) repeat protein
MQSSNDSFWADIKRFEDRLKKDPESFCFSQLAESYLQVGLVDDALSVARSGVAIHPGYVAGQLVFAKACFRKGLQDDCKKALENVTSAVPENAEAQRMLARLYAESGRDDAAAQVLKTLLEFCPDDQMARAELDALQGGVMDDDLEIIEFTEADIIHDETESAPVVTSAVKHAAFEEPVPIVEEEPWQAEEAEEEAVQSGFMPEASVEKDPLTTGTLAELYVSQGFISKAIEIYRDILQADPGNATVLARLAELEPEDVPAPAVSVVEAKVVAPPAVKPVPATGEADTGAVEILEGWLDNARRLRACR